jgi:hypothetical protein
MFVAYSQSEPKRRATGLLTPGWTGRAGRYGYQSVRHFAASPFRGRIARQARVTKDDRLRCPTLGRRARDGLGARRLLKRLRCREGHALVRRCLTSIAIPCLNGMPPSLQSIFRDRRTRLRSRQHCVMQTNGRSVRICVTHRTLPVNQNCPNHEGSGPREYGKSILKTHPLQGPRSRLPTLPEALGYPPFRLHLSRSSMMIADVTPHSSGLN